MCVSVELLKMEVERDMIWEGVKVVDVLVRRQMQLYLAGRGYDEGSIVEGVRYCLSLFWLCKEER